MIVVLLVAILVAPFFIDWSSHKDVFEREATRLLGHPVRVNGDADAQILPIPTFTFDNVEVGPDGEAPIMSAARLKIRVELMPLFQKEIEVIDMELDGPQVSIRVDEDGKSNWALDEIEASIQDKFVVKLGPVTLRNGRIYAANVAQDVSFTFDRINATVTAQSLFGPWKAEGSGVEENGLVDFKISTGKFANGEIRVKTYLEPEDLPFNATFDGVFDLGGAEKESRFPTYRGALKMNEVTPADPNAARQIRAKAPDGWTLDGAFEVDHEKFLVSKALFEDGAQDAPLNLNGAVRIPFGTEARFDAVISSRQIDLDRAYGEGPSAPIRLEEAQNVIADVIQGLPKPPIPGRIGVDIPGIVVGGDVIRSVHFDVTPSSTGWMIDDFGALLPGNTQTRFSGAIDLRDGLELAGKFNIRSERPVAFARWWRPGQNEAVRRFRIGSYSIRGDILSERNMLRLDDVRVDIDDSDLSGSIVIDHLSEKHDLFDANLTAKRLNIDAVQALAALFVGKGNLGGFDGKDTVSLKIAANTIISQSIEGRNINLDVRISEGEIDVNDLRIEDFAGINVNASGHINDILTNPTGRFSGDIKAASLDGLIKIGDAVVPGNPIIDYLRRHGEALAPLDLAVNFSGDRGEGTSSGAANDIAATVQGDLGDGLVKTGFRFRGDWNKPLDGQVEVVLETDYETTAGLLRQIAWPLVDTGEAGQASLNLRAEGKPRDNIDLSLNGFLTGTSVDSALSLSFDDDFVATYKGKGRLKSRDSEPLIRILGYAIPAMGTGMPVDLTVEVKGKGWSGAFEQINGTLWGDEISAELGFEGSRPGQSGLWKWRGNLETEEISLPWLSAFATGEIIVPEDLTLQATTEEVSQAQEGKGDHESIWPRRLYAKPYLDNVNADLKVSAHEASIADGYEAQNVSFHLRLRPQEIEFSDIKARFAEGSAHGRFGLENVDGAVSLRGTMELAGASAEDLLWSDGQRPLVEGRLTINSQFEGVGRSLDAIVASLGGGGSIQIENARLRRLNPAAFGLIVNAADKDLQLDEKVVVPLVESHLDAGALRIDLAEAPFTITSGALRIANTNLETASNVASLQTFAGATLNLTDLSLSATMALNVDAVSLDENPVSGAVPEIAVMFEGPFAEPKRNLDVQPLLGYLTVRRFEQEVRRVELLQADVLEKQRLSRYARWISAEEAREQREAEEHERRRLEQIKLEEEAERQRQEEVRRQQDEARRQQEELRRRAEAREAAERQEREALEQQRQVAEKERRDRQERARLSREALSRAIAEQERQNNRIVLSDEEALVNRERAAGAPPERPEFINVEETLRLYNEQRDSEDSSIATEQATGAPLELRPAAQ